MTTFNCMRPGKDLLKQNKRRHRQMLESLIGMTVIGHNIIIDSVTAVDLDRNTVTGTNRLTGEEVTVNWNKITFTERR